MDDKLLNQLMDIEKILGTIENESIRVAIQFFKNALEQSLAEIQKLKNENQQLRDENSRLKGEQGKPSIRPQTQDGNISSEKERSSPKKARKKKVKKPR